MRSRSPLTLLAVVLSTLALAACGGDDDAPIEPITTTAEETESAGLSVTQFVSRADPLCVEANVAITGLQQSAAAGDLATAAGQEREITEGVLAGVDAIPAPAEGKAPLRRYKAALQRQIEILDRREDAARGGESATYEMLGGELAQAKADALVAATEFGFEECGQEGTTLEGETAPGGSTGGSPPPATGGAAPPTTAPTPAPAPAPAPAPPAPPAPSNPDSGGAAPDSGGGGSGGGGSSSGGVGPG